MSIGPIPNCTKRQNRESAYRYRIPRHSNSFPCNSNRVRRIANALSVGPRLPQLATTPDSRSRNSGASNNNSIADIRGPRHEGPEGHDDRRGAHYDYKNRTHGHFRARQTIGRGTDRQRYNHRLHHHDQERAPRASSTKPRQPLEEFFVPSSSISLHCLNPPRPAPL